MNPLFLYELHHRLGANFCAVNEMQVVSDYGRGTLEYAALHESAGLMDLSFRSRLCLTGVDRTRYLHGQVTNDVKKLSEGEGTYAAVTTNKGKMESDLNIFCLAEELLLDFEPGLTGKITARLEKFVVADDVQLTDAAPYYGLLSVQGPKAAEAILALGLFGGSSQAWPAKPLASMKISDPTLGDIYLACNPRLGPSLQATGGDKGANRPVGGVTTGFDLFVPNHSLGAVADKLLAAVNRAGGRAVGWSAWETVRIEAGLPRYGADMDESNLPPECGIESRAVAYDKGCYIGQEVLNRIHSIGRVNRELRGLRLEAQLPSLPAHGDRLFFEGREVGLITSAADSPAYGKIALGCVRREAAAFGTGLTWKSVDGESTAVVASLPFS